MPDLAENIAAILNEKFTPRMTGLCHGAGINVDEQYVLDLVHEQCAEWAQVLAAALRAQIRSVAFKGPGHTDIDAFREAAAKLDAGYQPGGGNVTYPVSRLLRQAAIGLKGLQH